MLDAHPAVASLVEGRLMVRDVELPEGSRKTLSLVSSSSGTGEIKLYKVHKNTLEQIEDFRITKALCEFGRIEEAEN